MTITVIPVRIMSGQCTKCYVITKRLRGYIDNNLSLFEWSIKLDDSLFKRALFLYKLEDLKEFLTENEYLELQKEIFEKMI